jgi:arginase family enzyme
MLILCIPDTLQSHANIEAGVRAILAAGAVPIVLGGDHSVNIPCINAFSEQAPVHLVQIDAHLDFVDERPWGEIWAWEPDAARGGKALCDGTVANRHSQCVFDRQ